MCLLLPIGELLKLQPLLLAHGRRRELGLCRSHPQRRTQEQKTQAIAAQLVPEAKGRNQVDDGDAGDAYIGRC